MRGAEHIKICGQGLKNMQGHKQRFQNGFDCQGLWVEVEVEKELGFKSKKILKLLVLPNLLNYVRNESKNILESKQNKVKD